MVIKSNLAKIFELKFKSNSRKIYHVHSGAMGGQSPCSNYKFCFETAYEQAVWK